MNQEPTQLDFLQSEALKMFTREYDGTHWMRNVHILAPIRPTLAALIDLGLAIRDDQFAGFSDYCLTHAGTLARSHVASGKTVAICPPSPEAAPDKSFELSDEVTVRIFTEQMLNKLRKKAAEGRSGWQTCSQEDLTRMLREHVEKGDPVDVANFCMMLAARGLPIGPAAFDGKTVADRLDQMADAQPSGSSAQSDLYAAATVWRKHLAPPVTAQAEEFWTWLDLAYRDGSKGEEPKFTKYNMEVAYRAGAEAALRSHGAQAGDDVIKLFERIISQSPADLDKATEDNPWYQVMASEVRAFAAAIATQPAAQTECFCVEHGLHIETLQQRLAEAEALLTQVTENEQDGIPHATIGEFLARDAQAGTEALARADAALKPYLAAVDEGIRRVKEGRCPACNDQPDQDHPGTCSTCHKNGWDQAGEGEK